MGMEMGGNGNGNDSMGVGREWKQESHSRTPLLATLANTLKTLFFAGGGAGAFPPGVRIPNNFAQFVGSRPATTGIIHKNAP